MAGMHLRSDTALAILKDVQQACYETAKDHGWWEDHDALMTHLPDGGGDPQAIAGDHRRIIDDLVMSSKIMLTVTELAEGIENLRHGFEPDQHLPEFKGMEVELADTLVRIFDLSERFGFRLPEALLAKMEFNKTRPHKHGNKKQ